MHRLSLPIGAQSASCNLSRQDMEPNENDTEKNRVPNAQAAPVTDGLLLRVSVDCVHASAQGASARTVGITAEGWMFHPLS